MNSGDQRAAPPLNSVTTSLPKGFTTFDVRLNFLVCQRAYPDIGVHVEGVNSGADANCDTSCDGVGVPAECA